MFAVIISPNHGEHLNIEEDERQILQASITLDRNKINLLANANDGKQRYYQKKNVFHSIDYFPETKSGFHQVVCSATGTTHTRCWSAAK
ncbi:MAG: hypothetical protein ACLPPF_08155 [Rhodomicrobium sp.]